MTTALLHLCFFASGFAALLYQTAWTREFATVFGTSELAISVVLAGYMAGLAAGAAVAGRYANFARRPVLLYGVLEAGIGLGALAVPLGIQAVSALYVASFGGTPLTEETSLPRTLFQVAGAFAVMLPCAAMMGATLPLLARHSVQSDDQLGARVGQLYATNTAGAIAGTLCAGFWLLPALGLRGTIHTGVAINVLVFGLAYLLSRSAGQLATEVRRHQESGPRWILFAMLVSGAVSFSYEVVWTRLLGQVIGGSTPAFSTMLSSFLLGITLGSALASRRARDPEVARRDFVWTQLGIALFGWLSFACADLLPELAGRLEVNAYRPALGAVLGVAFLLPVTLCLGATFPLAVRIHGRGAEDAGGASARVYSWNTLGSILGATSTGLLLLPALAFEGTVALCVAASLLLALMTAVTQEHRSPVMLGAALTGLVGLLLIPPAAPERLLRQAPLSGNEHPGEVRYIGVGRSATVLLAERHARFRVATNGLPEAWIDSPNYPPNAPGEARWLGIVPVLARADVERLLLIGLGGGETLAAVPPSVDRIDVVELEPKVVRANRLAEPRRGGDPLSQDRVHLHVGDARGALMLSDVRYDAIVSQPSHPWTSGASHLYTKEFFELARDHLTPDGVLVQWMGSSYTSESTLRSLVATLLSVFPYVEVTRPIPASMVFVASNAPIDLVGSSAGVMAADPDAYHGQGIFGIEDVAALRAMPTEAAREFSQGAPLLTDDWNPLGRGLTPGLEGRGADRVFEPYDPLATTPDLDIAALVRRLAIRAHYGRLDSFVGGLERPERELARGWLAQERSQPRNAARHFEKAYELNPDSKTARLGWALYADEENGFAALDLDTRDGEVVAALRAAAREDWDRVAARDASLGLVPASHLLFPESVRARVDWRMARGEADRSTLALLDQVLETGWRGDDLLRRAHLAHRIGDDEMAWQMVDVAIYRVRRPENRAELARLVESLPETPGAAEVRANLTRAQARVLEKEGDAGAASAAGIESLDGAGR